MSVEQDLYELSKSSTISQHSSFPNLPVFGRPGNPLSCPDTCQEAGVRVAVKAARRATLAHGPSLTGQAPVCMGWEPLRQRAVLPHEN